MRPTECSTVRWLLLRGLSRETRHWGEFLRQIKRLEPRAEVRCLDLPGNGRNYQIASPATIDGMLTWLRERYAADEPAYLLGLSLGGMLAYHWMQCFPEEVRGVVMVNSSLAPLNPYPWRLRPSIYPRLFRALAASGRKREQIVFDLTCQSARRRQETIDQWFSYRQDCPVSAANGIRQLLAAARFRGSRQAPRRPVLLLSGARDRLVDPRCSEQLACSWHAPLRTHPDAGHDLPHDQGEWLVRQLNDWLRNGSGGAS